MIKNACIYLNKIQTRRNSDEEVDEYDHYSSKVKKEPTMKYEMDSIYRAISDLINKQSKKMIKYVNFGNIGLFRAI